MSEISKCLDAFVKKNPKLTRKDSGIIKTIQMDSPQLNFLFGGGIPIGRIHRLRGPSSGGKSVISTYEAAQIQKKLPNLLGKPDKNVVVYVDFERTFSIKFAEEIGLDCSEDKFIHLLPDDIETATDVLVELIKLDKIAAVIFDSDGACASRAIMADSAGHASFGGAARALSEMLKKINIICGNYDTTMFWVSQERANIGNPMSHMPACTGGEAPQFYSSTVNRVTKIDVIKQGNETVGQQIRVRNYKNKTSIPFRDAVVNLYFKGGFKPEEEYLDFFISFGLFKQGGAWYTHPEYGKFNGRAKIQEWLAEHPTEFELMRKEVDNLLCKETDLDKNNADPEKEPDEDFSITETDLEEEI